jgi:hypothetical protein
MGRQDSSDFELKYPPTEDLSPRRLKLVPVSDRASKRRDLYVFLVHGFNVRGWAAEVGFGTFRENALAVSARLAANMLSVTWPGKLAYWEAIAVAKESAVLFAEHLASLGRVDRRIHLVLVGHSMGCRVILETLERLMRKPGALDNVDLDVFLMAAAVPTDLVRAGGRLHPAATTSTIRMVFYSAIDQALLVFPIGQRIAAASEPEEGFYPQAVGWKGGPEGVWTDRERKWYLHGQYWTSKPVVQAVARKLRLEESRELPEREFGRRPLDASRPERLGARRTG